MVGGGLFPSPPVTKKSPTPTEKSPTVISKRCWTLEYSGELEFSSPFMEQWTLDARGVLTNRLKVDILSWPKHAHRKCDADKRKRLSAYKCGFCYRFAEF